MKPHRVRLAPILLPPEHLDRNYLIVVLRRHHRGETKFNEVVDSPHGLRGVCQLVEGTDAALI